MDRISSNWTIFYKIFIPTAWITFFGLFTIAILLSEPATLPFGGGWPFKLGFAVGFALFFAFMWFTIMRLKRVDMGPDGVYVSNYFKTYRYAYQDIEEIKEIDLLVTTLGRLTLKQKGKFGRRIYFIISKVHYNAFLQNNGHLLSHLLES